MSLLEPRPPGDRTSALVMLAIVALILAGSTLLLATAGDPLLEKKAPLLLITDDGVKAGVAVVVKEGDGEALVRVPRGLAGLDGLLILVDSSGGGPARVYAAQWGGAPLGLPWLARLSLVGEARVDGLDSCGYKTEVIDSLSWPVRLAVARLEAGEGLDGVIALLYTGEARALGSAVVTVNGAPVSIEPGVNAPADLLSLNLPQGLRGVRTAPAWLVVEARLVAAEVVVGDGGCGLTISVALLEPVAAEALEEAPEPGSTVEPIGVDRCEPVLARGEDLGRSLYAQRYSSPTEPYAFPLELGGQQRTALLNLKLDGVTVEVSVKPLKQGQYMVCSLTDPAGNQLPLARAFPVAEAQGATGGG